MQRLPTLLVLVSSIGCATAAPPKTNQQPTPPRAGQVSYRLIEDPAGRPLENDVEGRPQELVPATANHQNAPPAYPQEALGQGCSDTWVVVRLMIDVQGDVGEIRDSPFGESTPSPCLQLFRTATETAVRSWRFAPAFRQTLVQPATDGPFGQPKWEGQAIPWYADFAFKFQIVEGKGVVTVPK
jgi:outer membrane biosynthesis protein TonB